ncbi:MAG TPA: family 1 encapsulin nanocompartment shell protein [Chloroflexota bacterium]|nr:family 1 encapsulin nanocompartment shell protein [Chloroflexota bacterium]HZU06418.1 family 1 encapsulin nanocompartment shell protein [Chloroflexota bacterium]
MVDYLLRDQAPLTAEEWARIDAVVVEVARSVLVGRRIVPLLGPLGAGVQVVPDEVFRDAERGGIDLLGEAEAGVVRGVERRYRTIPLLYKDFRLHWRDLETHRQLRLPLDLGPVAAAATAVARAEDELIFNGEPRLGHEGLLNAAGRGVLAISDWATPGAAFRDIVTATQHLTDVGFYGPYALVTSPRLYAAMNRVYENTGVLEIEQVQKLTTAGVYRSAAVPDDRALVLATGASNVDLVVAQDFVTAYVTPENLNHVFRVLEAVALRIKRPQAIVTLEPGRAG